MKNKPKVSMIRIIVVIVTLFLMFRFKAYWLAGIVGGCNCIVLGLQGRSSGKMTPKSLIISGILVIIITVIMVIFKI